MTNPKGLNHLNIMLQATNTRDRAQSHSVAYISRPERNAEDSLNCSPPRISLVKGERHMRFEGKLELPKERQNPYRVIRQRTRQCDPRSTSHLKDKDKRNNEKKPFLTV